MELRPLTVRSKTRLPSSAARPRPRRSPRRPPSCPVTRVRRVTVPAPCISVFSISVASTWATAPGVPTAATPVGPSITTTVRLAPRRTGRHSSHLLLDHLVEVEGDRRVGLRGSRWLVSSRWTTSVSRSTWPQRDRRLLPDRLRGPRPRDDLLQPHRQRGERGAQLVRGVGGQPALGGEHPARSARRWRRAPRRPGRARARRSGGGAAAGRRSRGARRSRRGRSAGGPGAWPARRRARRRRHREQRHREDQQQRAADLRGRRSSADSSTSTVSPCSLPPGLG